MKDKIILVGGGGHCRACIDVIEQENRFEIAGIVERTGVKANGMVMGYPILGTDDELAGLRKDFTLAFITVGQIKSPDIRINLFESLKIHGFELPIIISPLSYVSRHSEVGNGTIIMHHALVNAGAFIGSNCIINSKALVEHDAIVENHCHIATGAIVNGGATVKEGAFMGSNAVSREGVTIGRKSLVGAGAKVLQNFENKNET